MKSKECEIILNVVPLDAENETQYFLRHSLERHNFSLVEVGRFCGSRSFNMQFHYNLATSVTAGRG